jgi:hypothetical protein
MVSAGSVGAPAGACDTGAANFTIVTDSINLFGGNAYRIPATSGSRSRHARARRRGPNRITPSLRYSIGVDPEYREARGAEERCFLGSDCDAK